MNEQRYHLEQILQSLSDGVFAINQDLLITYANRAVCDILGFELDELMGSAVTDYLSDLSILESCKLEVEKNGFCREQITSFKRKDGTAVQVSKSVQVLPDGGAGTGSIMVVGIRDLTYQQELNERLIQSQQLLQSYNENLTALVQQRTESLYEQMAFLEDYKNAIDASNMVSKCGLNQVVIDVNQALCERSGYTADELIGKKVTYLWAKESLEIFPDILLSLVQGQQWKGAIKLISKSGEAFYLKSNIVPISPTAEGVRQFLIISNDVTPLMEATDTLTNRLLYNPLTRLPNRLKLLTDTENIEGNTQIILLNIDSFNEINTFYGHTLADQVLKSVAQFLESLVAEVSCATLYKLPVDEFAVVIADAGWSQERLESFVASILQQVAAQNFTIQGQEINVSITAGIASSEKVDENPREVLVATDMALKMAKKQRKPFVFYDPDLKIKQGYEQNLFWIKRLRCALDEDRMVPFFQPIVNAQTLQIERYECLIRMVETDGKVVTPFYFLEIAKKLKLYHRLTMIMIEKSFKQFANSPYCFAINLSIEDILDAKVSLWILENVRQCGFANRVIFEIVESENIQNYGEVNRFIKELKKYGAKVAIDDFGAGYSNFVYITRLEVDYIKIDGSIIKGILQNKSSQVITETIIDFARKLNIKTVAEFVSDEQVYDSIKALSIDSLQGYYFGEPQPYLI